MKLYCEEGKSQKEIAVIQSCSLNTVCHWMKKYGIPRRSIRDAVYLRNNPNGDPFFFKEPKSLGEAKLFGMGLGLYWGEGTKASKNSVRLGNSDPNLVKTFMRFLIECFGVRKGDFRFSLQLFKDIDKDAATRFWSSRLGVRTDQFTKPTVSPSQSQGTYKRRSQYGVVTLYYHNTRLRNLLVSMLELSGTSTLHKEDNNTPL